MTFTVVLFFEVILIGISLAMDAFAVSITDGLCYNNLSKRKGATIPATFGIFQMVMPIIGYFVAFGVSQAFETVFDAIDHWVAFVLLAIIGGKMLFDAIKEMRSKDEEETHLKEYSFVEVVIQGVATSIDALFVGISFATMEGLKDSIPNMLLSVAIIGVVTFIISLVGLLIGVKVGKALKKHASIAELIGGLVLIGIGLKILIEGLI
ncbi:MAG: manganese efflux pump MntP family protein [Clostridia bacterium]|nr:manganese efflux pump MntP family protein [Clostridia bacterium]